ncbi:hypothetical protein AB0876_28945 [Mycobacterium sp. NPDC049093]
MKIYVDENESPYFVEHVNRIYGSLGATLHTPQQEGLLGLKDIPLFEQLQAREFSGLITRDRQQLRRIDPETNQSEADKLHECGLHWIGHTAPSAEGVDLIAELTALYLSNWSALIDRMRLLTSPSAMEIKRSSQAVVKAFPLRRERK